MQHSNIFASKSETNTLMTSHFIKSELNHRFVSLPSILEVVLPFAKHHFCVPQISMSIKESETSIPLVITLTFTTRSSGQG